MKKNCSTCEFSSAESCEFVDGWTIVFVCAKGKEMRAIDVCPDWEEEKKDEI